MKTLLLSVLLATSLVASASTNSPAMAEILSTNRVWTSIGANQEPFDATNHQGSTFVACYEKFVGRNGQITIFHDAKISSISITNTPNGEVEVVFEKDGMKGKFYLKAGKKPYKLIPLEAEALADAAERTRKRRR